MIPMPRLLNMKKKLAATSESEGDQEQRPGKRRINQNKITAEYKSIVNPPSVCSKLFNPVSCKVGIYY
ncbi:hypothetical protein JTB14_028871 [Gonioctena quinquepunctata]|nr:hypothetical protein JTB14_028871 [Gonioctena quinquepunctata]